MKSFIIAIVFLVIGGVVGGFVALSVGTGLGAGVGVATGLQAGACSTLEAAKARGLVTDEQFDEVLGAAMAQIADLGELPPDAALAGTAAECAKVIAGLQQAGESQ
ncbi:MAG: hypothetical protein U9Q81_18395 [Pseudomonadota bacterium]|nr:hypothetical protein [Pseudomonadota bacterium]